MNISINAHSSIRIDFGKVVYFDPFRIENEAHDADVIFITHDHFDHFSVEDIRKVEKESTVYVIPECMYNLLGGENVVVIRPNEKLIVEGMDVYALPSYNIGKPFHPKDKGYVGYLVRIEDQTVYVAGDCDVNEDNSSISCDIALVPVGGKYTMDHEQAAGLVNRLRPKLAIPTHYGDIAGGYDAGEKFRQLVDEGIRVDILIS